MSQIKRTHQERRGYAHEEQCVHSMNKPIL
jgi:hypothetical protein